MLIDLKVMRHPSGRLTLTKKEEGDKFPEDCKGELFGNMDAGSFYRAVAQELHVLNRAGHNVTYSDSY